VISGQHHDRPTIFLERVDSFCGFRTYDVANKKRTNPLSSRSHVDSCTRLFLTERIGIHPHAGFLKESPSANQDDLAFNLSSDTPARNHLNLPRFEQGCWRNTIHQTSGNRMLGILLE